MSFKAFIVDSTMRRMELDVVHASEYDTLAAENAALRSRLAEETDIVNRIWAIYGPPTYEALNGRSIYDLIQSDRSRLAEADALLLALRPFVYGLDRIKAIDAHLSRSVTAPE